MSGGVGTLRYMAQEVVRYEQYTDCIDICSFALILHFMCTGKQPFCEIRGADPEKVLKMYLQGLEPRPTLNNNAGGPRRWRVTPGGLGSAHPRRQRARALQGFRAQPRTKGSLSPGPGPLPAHFRRGPRLPQWGALR